MGKTILITVSEREITVLEFDSFKSAQTEMKRQLYDEVLKGNADAYEKGNHYDCHENSAFANDFCHHNYDWLIHSLQDADSMKCYHFVECGNNAAYELLTVENETIHVCENCDSQYTACEVCGKQGIWDGGYGNMGKYRETDDWPTCFLCQEILGKIKEQIDNGVQLPEITGSQYKAHHLEIYETGNLTGYIQGYVEFENCDKAHEFLYRVHDPKNGDAFKLVSIDYGYLNPLAEELWNAIEASLKQVYENFISKAA